MRILIAGLPGSGKTTQAKQIADYLKVCFITTGEALRELSKNNSPIGQKVKQAVESGRLVDDAIVAEVIEQKVKQSECDRGFVMEGYPRTINQLKLFNPLFDKMFYLNVSIDEAKRRLFLRGRGDDQQEIIENRLLAQRENLLQIVNYYRSRGLLVEINSEQDVEVVAQQIKEYLK